MSDPRIRPAAPDDVPAMVRLVHVLADHEGGGDECILTPAALEAHLFGDAPALFADVAQVDGKVVGVALWFLTFSTWHGVHGIWLEDLCVDPDHRGGGLGRALLGTLAARCLDRGYTRLEWNATVGNDPAIGLYDAVGATVKQHSLEYRLTGAALHALGSVS